MPNRYKPRHEADCNCVGCQLRRQEAARTRKLTKTNARLRRQAQERRLTLLRAQNKIFHQVEQADQLRGRLNSLRREVEDLQVENTRLKALAGPLLSSPDIRPLTSDLRPLDALAPLSLFYARYFRVARLGELSPRTIEKYDSTIATWARLTGDPPLAEITMQTLLAFREALRASAGKQPGTLRSPNTIRGTLMHLQAVLDKAGPPGPRNRDAAGILSGPVPWVRRPREEATDPPVIEPATLAAVYAAAGQMTEPLIAGMAPPAWWRGLLCLAHNTLLRRRSLFELRWGDVDLLHGCLRMPADSMKSHRPMVIHLNAAAVGALEALTPIGVNLAENRLVFPGYVHMKTFHVAWRKLLDSAGVPAEKRFGLHAIRANSARLLWESNPQAAQAALGHRSIEVTRKHYVNGGEMTSKALDGLPQPWTEA